MSAPLARRLCSPFPFVLALILVGCQTGPPATNVASASPGPGASLTADPGPSSQALIAADLQAGTIDEGTALQFRAWALFGDARLPERYDGGGSTGDDPRLLRDIETALPSLSPDLKTALEPFLLRPTNPDSPFSRPPTAGVSLAAYTAQATPEPTQCTLPWKWVSDEWSADGSADRGFRVWACATSAGEAKARSDIQTVLSMGEQLWPAMVAVEPAGMGTPAPDTDARQNDGNGKTDVYLLEDLAQCRQRGDLCRTITGSPAALAQPDWPRNCAVADFPANSCSGYILVQRSYVGDPNLAGTFAHEFFHILQFAHNGWLRGNWYEEASATWAKWHYVGNSESFSAAEKAAARENTYDKFRKYQAADDSLLEYNPSDDPDAPRPQYQAWAWPLFQTLKDPGAVFSTWSDLETASSLNLEDIDAAVDRQLQFKSEFRNFMVQNAQPAAYIYGSSTGLEADRWQAKEGLGDFPQDPHKVSHQGGALSLGKNEYPADDVVPLAAAFDEYEVIGDQIRQVEIDISKLTNAGNADLDVLAQIRSKSGDKWTRFPGSGGKVKLCRDIDAEDVNTVLAIVISNHAVARSGDRPDTTQSVKGNYTIESKNKCDERELHIGGRITWNATMPDELAGTRSVSGTADVVIHVTESRLIAELEDHSTYSYDFTGPPEQCPSSHEAGTLDTLGRQFGPAGPVDYSGGTLIMGGRLGQDLNLHITMFDYCGPPMGDHVGGDYFAFQGFPSCALNDQIVARFDGVESYVIDCDVIAWGGGSASASGHISGVLRPLDGPHPTPPN